MKQAFLIKDFFVPFALLGAGYVLIAVLPSSFAFVGPTSGCMLCCAWLLLQAILGSSKNVSARYFVCLLAGLTILTEAFAVGLHDSRDPHPDMMLALVFEFLSDIYGGTVVTLLLSDAMPKMQNIFPQKGKHLPSFLVDFAPLMPITTVLIMQCLTFGFLIASYNLPVKHHGVSISFSVKANQ